MPFRHIRGVMAPGFGVFALSVLGLSFVSCQLEENKKPALQMYRSGQYSQAYKEFKKGQGEPILRELDSAMASLASDKNAESRQHFEEGIRRADAQRGTDVFEDAASLFAGDGVKPYLSAPYERIASRVFWAFSYLLGGESTRMESVSAACRDLDGAMEKIEALYEHVYEYDADGKPSEFNFRVPPLGKYLAAIAAHYRGEADNAAIYMNQALEGLGKSEFLNQEKTWMESGNAENRVIVFALLGLAPKKKESSDQKLDDVFEGLSALYSASKGRTVTRSEMPKVKIPVLEAKAGREHQGFSIELVGEGAMANTQLIADFDAYAREEMKTLESGMLIGAGFRALVRTAGGQSVDHNLGVADLGSAVADTIGTLQGTDIRSWVTLPGSVHAAAFNASGDQGTLTISGAGASGLQVPLANLGSDPAVVVLFQPNPSAKPMVIVSEAHRPKKAVAESTGEATDPIKSLIEEDEPESPEMDEGEASDAEEGERR